MNEIKEEKYFRVDEEKLDGRAIDFDYLLECIKLNRLKSVTLDSTMQVWKPSSMQISTDQLASVGIDNKVVAIAVTSAGQLVVANSQALQAWNITCSPPKKLWEKRAFTTIKGIFPLLDDKLLVCQSGDLGDDIVLFDLNNHSLKNLTETLFVAPPEYDCEYWKLHYRNEERGPVFSVHDLEDCYSPTTKVLSVQPLLNTRHKCLTNITLLRNGGWCALYQYEHDLSLNVEGFFESRNYTNILRKIEKTSTQQLYVWDFDAARLIPSPELPTAIQKDIVPAWTRSEEEKYQSFEKPVALNNSVPVWPSADEKAITVEYDLTKLLTRSDLHKLIQVIADNTSLTSLKLVGLGLVGLGLGDVEAEILSKRLSKPSKLGYFDLTGNNISDSGAVKLLDSLSTNPDVLLILGGNPISDNLLKKYGHEDGRTAIQSAMGDSEKFSKLLDCVSDIKGTKKTSDGYNLLHLACVRGDIASAELLIKRGMNLGVRTHDGFLPMHIAAHHNQTKEPLVFLQWLMDEGECKVDEETHNKTTPLMLASALGHLDRVKFLIEAGAGLDKFNTYGMTALSLASEYGHYECAELLISKGANVNLAAEELTSNVSLAHMSEITPLVLAAKGNHLAVLQLLLKEGAQLPDNLLELVPAASHELELLIMRYKRSESRINGLTYARFYGRKVAQSTQIFPCCNTPQWYYSENPEENGEAELSYYCCCIPCMVGNQIVSGFLGCFAFMFCLGRDCCGKDIKKKDFSHS